MRKSWTKFFCGQKFVRFLLKKWAITLFYFSPKNCGKAFVVLSKKCHVFYTSLFGPVSYKVLNYWSNIKYFVVYHVKHVAWWYAITCWRLGFKPRVACIFAVFLQLRVFLSLGLGCAGKKHKRNRDGMRTGTRVKRGLEKENGRNRQTKVRPKLGSGLEYGLKVDWNMDWT